MASAEKEQTHAGVPVAALVARCPMLAAIILVYQANKTADVIALLKRSSDFKRIKVKGLVCGNPGIDASGERVVIWCPAPDRNASSGL